LKIDAETKVDQDCPDLPNEDVPGGNVDIMSQLQIVAEE